MGCYLFTLYELEELVQVPGSIAQSIMYLAGGPGVASSIPTQSHTFVEIDREIISTAILSSADSRGLLSVTSKSMCMKYWLTT